MTSPMAKSPKKPPAPPAEADEDERVTFPPLPLKAWFKRYHVRAYQVADYIGVQESHLSNIAGGKRPYLRTHLEGIARYLSEISGGDVITPSMLLHPPAEKSLADVISRIPAEQHGRAAAVLDAAFVKKK